MRRDITTVLSGNGRSTMIGDHGEHERPARRLPYGDSLFCLSVFRIAFSLHFGGTTTQSKCCVTTCHYRILYTELSSVRKAAEIIATVCCQIAHSILGCIMCCGQPRNTIIY